MKMFAVLAGVLIILVAGFLVYEGVFYPVTPKEEVIGDYWVVYEGNIGPYEKVAPVMDKICQNLKNDGIDTNVSFGIYYDNPKKVERAKLRSEVGAVLDKKYYDKIDSLKSKYNVKRIKKRKSLVAKFPLKNVLSYMIGPVKVYPVMEKYCEEKNIDIGKVKDGYGLEIYDTRNKQITYILPIE